MIQIIASLALLAAQASAAPAPAAEAKPLPDLSATQSAALRCGVAFGMVHRLQRAGDPAGTQYPAMAERGQEFFVRTTAQLMDEIDADRETIGMLVLREIKDIEGKASLHQVMPPCLAMLDAAGV